MEQQTKTIIQPLSVLLRQVAKHMHGREDDEPIMVPVETTWKTVLHAIVSALGERDGPMTVRKPRTEEHKRRMRQIALENVAAWKAEAEAAESESSSTKTLPGLPIRTQYDISSLPMPRRATKEQKQRLKENMIPFEDINRDPYPIILTAAVTEGNLPLVKANLVLDGIDVEFDGLEKLDSVEMLWDTGAQSTLITEDLLSEEFRRFLQNPPHDLYRSDNKQCVQLDIVVAFSNTSVEMKAIALIVPKSAIPNQRSGIIFGQRQCIDCMNYRSMPRSILRALGQEVDDETWGDFVIDQIIDEYGDLVSV
jgi:hypothetical protein